MNKAIASFDRLRIAGDGNAEIFVVDNNSSDDTIAYLQTRFPLVKFISNKENTGFAKANNQALRMTNGEFILFLNPDTILPENFFLKCIAFMEQDKHMGAVGVQMIDGTGTYLKESKRGFPTTWVSFCRLSGLTNLFPHTELFAKYYLGHLDRNENHEAEALSGACMFIKKEVLDTCGGFDERFFMYAEDIDLSYRINLSGYTNFYLADVTIIHFKGESTTKDIRYVQLFYRAMIQFVQKHYSGTRGRLYTQFLRMAIGFRSLFAVGSLHLTGQTLKQEAGMRKILFKGDASCIKEIRHLIPGSGVSTIVEDSTEAHETIFCEGQDFSFNEMIDYMKRSPGKSYKIHSQDSSSIIGSDDSQSAGTVIVLSKKVTK